MVNEASRRGRIRECHGGVGSDVDLRLTVFEIDRAVSSGLDLSRQSELSRITDSHDMICLGDVDATMARDHRN
jgi:hypothetical protein